MRYRHKAIQTTTSYQVADAPTDENTAPAAAQPIAEEPEAEATAENEVSPA